MNIVYDHTIDLVSELRGIQSRRLRLNEVQMDLFGNRKYYIRSVNERFKFEI